MIANSGTVKLQSYYCGYPQFSGLLCSHHLNAAKEISNFTSRGEIQKTKTVVYLETTTPANSKLFPLIYIIHAWPTSYPFKVSWSGKFLILSIYWFY